MELKIGTHQLISIDVNIHTAAIYRYIYQYMFMLLSDTRYDEDDQIRLSVCAD